jgi:hypothetical protein
VVILLLAAYIAVSGLLGIDSGTVKVKTNTVVKYVCPSGDIVNDSSKCAAATSTVSTSGGTSGVCPTTLPCSCGVVKTTTTSTIKVGPPCETDSDCGQIRYGDARCSNGNVYNVRITPTCDEKHCKELQNYELKEECPTGKTCVDGQCVDEKQSD